MDTLHRTDLWDIPFYCADRGHCTGIIGVCEQNFNVYKETDLYCLVCELGGFLVYTLNVAIGLKSLTDT